MKISTTTISAEKLGEHLFKDQDFTDVSLVCGDGRQVSCHRAVLAAASPFLRQLLYETLNQATFLFLGVNVGLKEVEALMELVYLGKVSLLEARLPAFKALARELGLDNGMLYEDEVGDRSEFSTGLEVDSSPVEKDNQQSSSVTFKKRAKCPQCGTEVSYKSLSRHILRNHTGGDSLKVACEQCEKVFKHKSHLMKHMKRKRCRADPEKWPLLCARGCGKRFRTTHTMQRHQKHGCPVNLKCGNCPESFSKFRQLEKHRTFCLGDGQEKEEEEEEEEMVTMFMEEEEEMVTMFMEEEEALTELERELREFE